MGLDIYLYTAEQHARDEVHEKASDELYARFDRGEITEDEREAGYKDLPPYARHEDVPSKNYPDHLFNRRYLRSSYNGSGFNYAVPDFLGDPDKGSLYWIFEPMGREWDGDEGVLTTGDLPKLAEARERAVEVAEELRKCDPLRATAVNAPPLGGTDYMWSKPPTEAEVLAWYREEQQRGSSFESYSNAKGHVFGKEKGMEVLAVTVGRDIIGQPAAVLVYRSEAVESYIQSAEIVAEFIDEAIDLISSDSSAYISWSG